MPDAIRSRFSYTTVFNGKEQEGSGEAIHLATSRGHVELVSWLMKRRADIQAEVTRGGLPHYGTLHAAVFAEGKKAKPEMVKFLLEHHVNPVKVNADGKTPLHLAYQTGSKGVIEIIQDWVVSSRQQSQSEAVKDGEEPEPEAEDDWTDSIDITDLQGKTPLEIGFHFGNLTRSELADLAPLSAKSLQIFLNFDPRCVPQFVKRAVAALKGDPAQLVADYKIDIAFIAELIRKSPDAAVKLLSTTTGPPRCENPGWHPVPLRACARAYMVAGEGWLLRKLMNPPPDIFSFYVPDSVWAFDANTFGPPAWHSRLKPMSLFDVDIDVQVCHIPALMSVDVFAALVQRDHLPMFGSVVIKSLIDEAWWQGPWRYDCMQLLLNIWVLGLLTISITSFGNETFRSNAMDFAGARGTIDLFFEAVEWAGCLRMGKASEFYRAGNFRDALTVLPLIALLFTKEKAFLSMTVAIMWARLLGFFRCAQNIAMVMLPIQRSAGCVVPALSVTLMLFLAILEAGYVYAADPDLNVVLYSQFSVFIAGEFPDEPLADPAAQVIMYAGVLVFTIYLLNIFISVISEAYRVELELVQLTFVRERCQGVLAFFLRASMLPSRLCPYLPCWFLIISIVLVSTLAWQVMGIPEHWRPLPFVLSSIALLLLEVSIFQKRDAPWETSGHNVAAYHLWIARPAKSDTSSEIHSLREEVSRLSEEVSSLRKTLQGDSSSDDELDAWAAFRSHQRSKDRKVTIVRRSSNDASGCTALPKPPVSGAEEEEEEAVEIAAISNSRKSRRRVRRFSKHRSFPLCGADVEGTFAEESHDQQYMLKPYNTVPQLSCDTKALTACV
eukprot:TRINITY_DN860_c0_g2_i1.p1 TRINITY_DN860_c0_g2~~TRINITY_DN860_c0_g2_i1.p1  ORF type:complete len:941 (+),score=103.03 TRINITY_DN860_c0_g2_i1:313-2823(+)